MAKGFFASRFWKARAWASNFWAGLAPVTPPPTLIVTVLGRLDTTLIVLGALKSPYTVLGRLDTTFTVVGEEM